MATDYPLRVLFKRLQRAVAILTANVATLNTVAAASRVRQFADLSSMLAADSTTWGMAMCDNYTSFDGVMTIWIKSYDTTVLPNGTDILQTADGQNIARMYVRENIDGPSIPSFTGTPYYISVPVVYPDMANARNGAENTQYVIVISDDNGNEAAFQPGGTTDDGVNGFLNSVGIYYQRI